MTDDIPARAATSEGERHPTDPAELIPYMPTKSELSELDVLAWKRFARRAQQNPFMQEHVRRLGGGRCAWCGGFVSNAAVVLHHTHYLHVCSFDRDIEIITKRGHRRNVPDCATCFADDEKRFHVCCRFLRLVHARCNLLIAELTPPAADHPGIRPSTSTGAGHQWRRIGPGESECKKCGLTARRQERKYERDGETWTEMAPPCDGRKKRRREAPKSSAAGPS